MVLQHARRLCLGQGSSGWGRHQQVLRLDVAVGGVSGVHRRERGQHLAQQVAQGLLTLDNHSMSQQCSLLGALQAPSWGWQQGGNAFLHDAQEAQSPAQQGAPWRAMHTHRCVGCSSASEQPTRHAVSGRSRLCRPTRRALVEKTAPGRSTASKH